MKYLSIALIFMIGFLTYYYLESDANQEGYREFLFLAADDIDFKIENQDLLIDSSPIFYLENAEPGSSQTKYIKIENSGTNELDYTMNFEITDSTIADIIIFEVQKVGQEESMEIISGMDIESKEIKGFDLSTGDYEIYKITVRVDENAGNEYNRHDIILQYTFDISLNTIHSTIEVIPLDDLYYGSVHERNWVRSIDAGRAEMLFPKIYSGNGWSVKNEKLQYEGIDLNNDPVFSAAIGIKTEKLLTDYPGYNLTSVTVNGEELINQEVLEDKWVESTDKWDLKKGFTHQIYLKIGEMIGDGTDMNHYHIMTLNHEIKITLSNDYDQKIFTLNVAVGELGGNK